VTVEPLADAWSWLGHLAMGVGLAAGAGLRAFLPPLVVGASARLGWVSLPEHFGWLAGTPALIVFGVAVAVELAGDKVPVIDHGLDVLATVVKPVAGAFVMLTVVDDWSPLSSAVVWIVLGGALAGGVHAVKSNVRLLSTATTGGLANPLVSAVEDLGALATAVGAVLAPLLVALVALGALVLLAVALRRRRRPQPA
jgi:hypothetical protein